MKDKPMDIENQVRDMKKLKPFNTVIQICPVCGKVDAYKDDGHNCEVEIRRQENLEYYD